VRHIDNIRYFIENYGAIGLFLANILDSSFFSMSGTMDGVLIALCMNSSLPGVFLNCFAATCGSVTGLLIMYITVRKGKDTFLKNYLGHFNKFKDFIEKYELPFFIFLCVVPPPFPFKIFLITSIIVCRRFSNFLTGIFIGRIFRYLFEGLLAWKYGSEIKYIMVNYYPYIILILIILGLLSYIVKRRFLVSSEQVKDKHNISGTAH
jgi:membrane protein YqaA with SNARE-associated domain